MATSNKTAVATASAALSALSPEMILDLVQRIGLLDIVANGIRRRLE
jgi:hypothetical protein